MSAIGVARSQQCLLSGHPALLRRHRAGALVDRQWSQVQIVGVGIFGFPDRAVAAVEIDEQLAGVGLVAQRTGGIVLAVEHAGAEQRRELRLVEALDAVGRESEPVVQPPRRSASASADRADLMPAILARDGWRIKGSARWQGRRLELLRHMDHRRHAQHRHNQVEDRDGTQEDDDDAGEPQHA